MKIALIGYGKMGKTVEAMGLQQGHTFPLIIDVDNKDDLNPEKVNGIDVAIEFSLPSAAPGNILECIRLGLPVVSGTTGWNDRLGEITGYCREKGGALFHASNFSIGVNIFFSVNRQLAKMMKNFSGYTVTMEEVHHVHKLDAPSGTAIILAQQIIEEQDRLKGWSREEDGDPAVLHIRSVREGEVKGRHTIRYISSLDTISLEHDAKSRDAFAAGALMAAAFLRGRTGIYSMADLLNV
jgi:4-hydroxy-tetrahydrodipicolinate reductase